MTQQTEMKPINKFLISATIDWIIESDCTPHIIVNTSNPKVMVPIKFVKENQILLNISANAVRNFQLTDEFLSFSSSFDGEKTNVFIPLGSVLAIMAKESGAIMPLPPMEYTPEAPETPPEPKKTKPTLRLV